MNCRIRAALLACAGSFVACEACAGTAEVISVGSATVTFHEPGQRCWPALITRGDHHLEEGERIRAETPWFVPVAVKTTGAVLGAVSGSRLGRGHGSDALTFAGGVLGAVFEPGAVIGAWVGGALIEEVAHGLGASERWGNVAAVIGALGGAVLGKTLFDMALGAFSPYYAHIAKGTPEKPEQLMQVERCAPRLHARHESSAFLVTYRHRSERRTATLPFDPGETVRVTDDGAIDETAYAVGVSDR